MKRNQSGLGHVILILIIVVVAAVGFAGWKVYDNQKSKTTTTASQSTTTNQPVTFTGAIKTVQSGSSYEVTKTTGDTVGVFVGSKDCDATAITVPQLKVGDKVSVSAVQSEDGYTVCTTGTYIKAVDTASYMIITQWGVKVPIDNSTKGINYVLDRKLLGGYTGVPAGFKDKALEAVTSDDCYNIIVTRGKAADYAPNETGSKTASDTYKANYEAAPKTKNSGTLVAVHIGDYYYMSFAAVATCTSKQSNVSKESTARSNIIKALNRMIAE